MANRRNDNDGSRIGRKLVTWAIIALIIVWASRNPHQAATVIHSIASGIASLASHYGNHS